MRRTEIIRRKEKAVWNEKDSLDKFDNYKIIRELKGLMEISQSIADLCYGFGKRLRGNVRQFRFG